MPLTDEQLAAVESIDQHVLVSAGAGSGKTSVLVERYLEVLRRNFEAEVGDIVAVTFTRKAAEEMRTRLKEGLRKLALGALADNERQRWEKCLVEIESSRIGTIHSLCDFLLKSHSTEAAVDPRFDLLDDLERAQLIDESIRESIADVLENQPHGFDDLLDLPLEQVKDMLKQLISSPLKYQESRRLFREGSDTWNSVSLSACIDRMRGFAAFFVQKIYSGVVKQLLARREFQLNAQYVLDTPWPDRDNVLAERQEQMCNLIIRLTDSDGEDHAALEQLAAFPLTRAGGEQGATLRGAIKDLRNAAKKVVGKLQPELTDADEVAFRVLAALIELADRARRLYEQGKLTNQKLDFDDLIARTAGLVHATDARRRITLPNMRALLVDEFQDTNSIQARMLASLAAGNAQTRLFLIGDDKQSIYKFQGADVSTFNVCKSFVASLSSAYEGVRQKVPGWPILEGDGQLRSLSRSFRSHPAIVEFVNVLFHRLFDAADNAEAYRSRFQALNAAREGDDETRVDIIAFSPPEVAPEAREQTPGSRAANAPLSMARVEAALVARHILERVNDGTTRLQDRDGGQPRQVRFGDFAILLQANGDFAAIEAALADAGIPYISFAGAGYLDRQEILDMENLLKWLLAPQDGHALMAALRSPLFGVSDDLIHDLKTRNPKSSLWFVLRQEAAARRDPVLLRCVSLLRDWVHRAGEYTVEELVRHIIMRSGIDIILPAVPGGKQRARNLWKFVHVAARHNHLGLRGFLLALQAMRDNGVKSLTDAPLTSDDAVKIMTVHKSKGLEFGVVILPRMARKVHGGGGRLLFSKEFGLAIDHTRDQEELKPAFFAAVDSFNRAVDEEEKKRLFYVALTRARDYLVLFLPAKTATSVSFAKWLRDGLELDELDMLEHQIEGTATSGGRSARFRLAAMYFDDLPLTSSREEGDLSHRILQDTSEIDTEHAASQEPPGCRDQPLDAEADTRESCKIPLDEIRFDLLEPMNIAAVEPGVVPWQALVRTTPSAASPIVHPTIVGSYFHLLMDRLSYTMEMVCRDVMTDLLVHPEVGVYHPVLQQQLLDEGEKLLTVFAASSLLQRMKKARRRIHETSWFTVKEGKVQSESRPDLVLEEEGGKWSIIDYKTDHFAPADLLKQARDHRAQLVGYADDFQKITGFEPRAFVYFAQHGVLHELDCLQPVQLKLI